MLKGTVPTRVFRDKIVVVGATAGGLNNLFTPFDRNPPTSGVFLEATVIDNLLQQRFLKAFETEWLIVILTLMGLGLSPFLFFYGWGRRLVLLTGLCVGWLALSFLFLERGYWLPIAAPLILFGLSTAIAEMGERLRMSSRLRWDIQRLWQFYRQDRLILKEPAPSLADSSIHAETRIGDYSSIEGLPSTLVQPVEQLAELAEQISRAQSAYGAIARNLSIGLLAVDRDECVWFCNPVAADWLQICLGDRLQTRLVPGWLSQDEWEASLQSLNEHQTFRRQLQRGERWFEIKLEPLFYQPPYQPR